VKLLVLVGCVAGFASAGAAEPGVHEQALARGLTARPVRLGASPVAVAVGGGAVWVVVEDSRGTARLWRLDDSTGKRLDAYTIGRAGPDFGAVAVSRRAVYAAAGEHVVRVDLSGRGRVVRATLPGEAAAVAAGPDDVWVATVGARYVVSRLGSATLAERGRARLTAQPTALQSAFRAIWLATTAGLWRVRTSGLTAVSEPAALPIALTTAERRLFVLERPDHVAELDGSGRLQRRIRLPFPAGSFAVAGGHVWATNNCGCRTGKIAMLTTAGTRVRTLNVGRTPVAVAATASTAWVASFADETLWRVAERR
jgi:hypothetical protein